MLVSIKRNFLLGMRKEFSYPDSLALFDLGIRKKHKMILDVVPQEAKTENLRSLTKYWLLNLLVWIEVWCTFSFCLMFLVRFETCSWDLNCLMLFRCCLLLLVQILSALKMTLEWDNCSHSFFSLSKSNNTEVVTIQNFNMVYLLYKQQSSQDIIDMTRHPLKYPMWKIYSCFDAS